MHLQLSNKKKRSSFKDHFVVFHSSPADQAPQAVCLAIAESPGLLNSRSRTACPRLCPGWEYPLVDLALGDLCCGELNSDSRSREPASETLVSNTKSYVQVSIVAHEVSFREWGAFLAVRWKTKRCLKLVLFFFFFLLRTILFTELLIQTVKNLKQETKCLRNKHSEDIIAYGEIFWQHAVK